MSHKAEESKTLETGHNIIHGAGPEEVCRTWIASTRERD
jgi:hypothetical protein